MNVLPKMQRLVVLFLFLISLLVVSCGTLEIGIERTATPDVVATNTMAAVATENAHLATQVATLSVTLTPTSPLSGVELPRKLYFLPTDLGSSEGSRGVWLFDPDNARVERITPPDLWITSFDVWPGDGRISYGTRSGQLYIVMPEQEPRLLYDADLQTDDDVWINSVAWSPEGTRLAYSVLYTSYGAGSLGQSDGLWLWVLGNEVPIKLLSNRHLEADHSNIKGFRSKWRKQEKEGQS
jgi:WD40 repeat protein